MSQRTRTPLGLARPLGYALAAFLTAFIGVIAHVRWQGMAGPVAIVIVSLLFGLIWHMRDKRDRG